MTIPWFSVLKALTRVPECSRSTCSTTGLLVNGYLLVSRFSVGDTQRPGSVVLTVWYADDTRRLIKQTTRAYGFLNLFKVNETVELAAVRRQ